MSADVARLILLNVLALVFGLGLMPLLGIARSRREVVQRSPLAYMIGIAVLGIIGATLALVHVPLGLLEVGVLAVAGVGGGAIALIERKPEAVTSPRATRAYERYSLAGGLIGLALSLLLATRATYAYAFRPLREYDGWAIWATKARALYEFGGAEAAVFASPLYDAPTHPLLLPSLEAMGFRAIGSFDPALLHVQLGVLAIGFAAAAWVVLQPVSSPLVAGATILAVMTAPAVFAQLGTNYADIPLGFFVSLGVVGLAGWLRTDANWLLVAGALFLAAAALTKSEGMLFAASALVAVICVAAARRRRLIPALAMAGAIVVVLVPWRVYVTAHDLTHPDYELSNLLDRAYLADTWYRVEPVTEELGRQLLNTGSWGLLLPLFAVGLVVAVLRRSIAVVAFAAGWVTLSLVGLVWIYWITVRPLTDNLFNTSNRTVAALLLGMGLVAPVLIGRPTDDPPARDGQ